MLNSQPISDQSAQTMPIAIGDAVSIERPKNNGTTLIDWEDFVRRSMVDLNQSYKTLLLKETSSGDDDPELIGCLDHLSEVHHALGNYAIAENYYHRSLSIKERI